MSQGARPEHMHVVPRRPDFPLQTFRTEDYLAYHRQVRRRLMAAVDEHTPRILQRLNYFRIAEIGGRYLGSREAGRVGRSFASGRAFGRIGSRAG